MILNQVQISKYVKVDLFITNYWRWEPKQKLFKRTLKFCKICQSSPSTVFWWICNFAIPMVAHVTRNPFIENVYRYPTTYSYQLLLINCWLGFLVTFTLTADWILITTLRFRLVTSSIRFMIGYSTGLKWEALTAIGYFLVKKHYIVRSNVKSANYLH